MLTLLMTGVAALQLDVSTIVDGRSLSFVKDGVVSAVLTPDYAAGTPCHPVPQFIDVRANSAEFVLNNTDPAASLQIHVSVSSDSQSPSVSPSAISLAPASVAQFEVTYNCESGGKPTAEHVSVVVDTGEDLLRMTFTHICDYQPQGRFDFSMAVLLCFAVAVVVVSSISAARPMQSAVIHEERTVLETKHAVGFIVLGSCALVALFFLAEYLIYILTVMLSFSMVTALVHLMSVVGKSLPDSLRCSGETRLPCIGQTSNETAVYTLLSFLVVVWYLFTKHWLLNNLLGGCFVFFFLSVIKLFGFRVGALLLFLAFFYDIFWVFYSEAIFGGNVMVTVATQVDLPIKLECVRFQSLLPHMCSMIGLGDLVLPGLVIAYAKVYDTASRGNYFVWAVLAYVIALLACGVALVVSSQAQPALLYISPCLIVCLTVVGLVRGDFCSFWRGSPLKPLASVPAYSEMQALT